MAIKVPEHIMQFSQNQPKFYEGFMDYYNHYRSINGNSKVEFDKNFSFDEKESKINAEMKKEILRIAGITNFSEFPVTAWASHPGLKWATFAVVSAVIDLVLPQTLIETIGMYSEIKEVGVGNSAAFDIKPRDLFTVSKVGRSKRTTFLNKQHNGQVVLLPSPRELTVFVSLQKVLAGQESLADFVAKAVRSMETELSYDVYATFKTALDAIDNTASTGLRVAGFTQSEWTRLAETVRSWNGGAQPIAIGTLTALSQILPTSDVNYRYSLTDDYVKLGYIKQFIGVDIIALPNLADYTTPFGLKLATDRIWMISPGAQKPVKVAIEMNSMAWTSDVYANSNLLQSSSIMKSWAAGIATNSVSGVFTL